MEAEEASACARALETLWRRCPSTRRSFDWSSSIAWLRSESDEVRYNACALVGLAMGLTTRAVWEMRAATTRDARAFHAYGARREARALAFVNERGAFWLSPGRDEIAMEDVDLSNGDRAPPADGYVRIGGVEVRRRSASAESASGRGRKSMVYTESARRNLGAVALALCQNRPVLLEGPAGGGSPSRSVRPEGGAII